MQAKKLGASREGVLPLAFPLGDADSDTRRGSTAFGAPNPPAVSRPTSRQLADRAFVPRWSWLHRFPNPA